LKTFLELYTRMFSKFGLLFISTILFLFGVVLQPVVAIEAEDLLQKLTAVVKKDTTPIPLNIIPQQCSTMCTDSVLGVYTNCTSTACACNDADSDMITACMNCLVTSNTLQQPVGNAIQSDYVRICTNMNIPVKNNVSGATALSARTMVVTVLGAVFVGLLV